MSDMGTDLEMNQKQVRLPWADRDPSRKKHTHIHTHTHTHTHTPTRRGMKSDSSNPTSAQPPSLLPPVLHRLIYRQGESHQDAMAWPAVHVLFTHDAGTVWAKEATQMRADQKENCQEKCFTE